MSIKNSLKLLFNRFGLVGEILLFLLVFAALFCGLGAILVRPVVEAAIDLDLSGVIKDFYEALLSGSGASVLIRKAAGVFATIKSIFIGEEGIIFSTFIVPFLLYVFFDMFFNMYQLPLCKVLDARMSSNAKLSLMGNVISLSGKSAIFVLVNLVFCTITDAVIFVVMWGCYKLLTSASLILVIPFAELLILIVLASLRKCLTITWVEEMVIGGRNVFSAFANSARDGFKRFVPTYGRLFVVMLIVIVVNVLMAVLTFGVGLIVSVPATMLLIKLTEMTAYYGWHNKRYYLDGHTIVEDNSELNEKLD